MYKYIYLWYSTSSVLLPPDVLNLKTNSLWFSGTLHVSSIYTVQSCLGKGHKMAANTFLPTHKSVVKKGFIDQNLSKTWRRLIGRICPIFTQEQTTPNKIMKSGRLINNYKCEHPRFNLSFQFELIVLKHMPKWYHPKHTTNTINFNFFDRCWVSMLSITSTWSR